MRCKRTQKIIGRTWFVIAGVLLWSLIFSPYIYAQCRNCGGSPPVTPRPSVVGSTSTTASRPHQETRVGFKVTATPVGSNNQPHRHAKDTVIYQGLPTRQELRNQGAPPWNYLRRTEQETASLQDGQRYKIEARDIFYKGDDQKGNPQFEERVVTMVGNQRVDGKHPKTGEDHYFSTGKLIKEWEGDGTKRAIISGKLRDPRGETGLTPIVLSERFNRAVTEFVREDQKVLERYAEQRQDPESFCPMCEVAERADALANAFANQGFNKAPGSAIDKMMTEARYADPNDPGGGSKLTRYTKDANGQGLDKYMYYYDRIDWDL
jgi:hypothetical protein